MTFESLAAAAALHTFGSSSPKTNLSNKWAFMTNWKLIDSSHLSKKPSMKQNVLEWAILARNTSKPKMKSTRKRKTICGLMEYNLGIYVLRYIKSYLICN